VLHRDLQVATDGACETTAAIEGRRTLHIRIIAANQLRRSILCEQSATTKAKRTYCADKDW